VDYPSKADERTIVDRMSVRSDEATKRRSDGGMGGNGVAGGDGRAGGADPVLSLEQVRRARAAADNVYLDGKIKDYIVNIVHATRRPLEYGLEVGRLIEYGASPRATIFLALAAKARAFLEGRGYVTPHDVKSVGMDVLRHRVIVTYEAEAQDLRSEDVVMRVLDHVPVP
jgi:MoxR-like ATPase